MLQGSIEYENTLLTVILEKNQIISAQAKRIQELNSIVEKYKKVESEPVVSGNVTLEE